MKYIDKMEQAVRDIEKSCWNMVKLLVVIALLSLLIRSACDTEENKIDCVPVEDHLVYQVAKNFVKLHLKGASRYQFPPYGCTYCDSVTVCYSKQDKNDFFRIESFVKYKAADKHVTTPGLTHRKFVCEIAGLRHDNPYTLIKLILGEPE